METLQTINMLFWVAITLLTIIYEAKISVELYETMELENRETAVFIWTVCIPITFGIGFVLFSFSSYVINFFA